MELLERRGLLTIRNNPDGRLDYVISLDGPGVALRYVPDRRVLEPDAFGRYLDALNAISWSSLEEMAVTVRDDINNEVIPRWLQVAVSASGDAFPAIGGHQVILEDRQPKWDNPTLLSLLKRV